MNTARTPGSDVEPRRARVQATRLAILDAAERLFAEHGIAAVSNRQVGEAAGQGNNTAVGYHFGTRTDLVRAIVRRHQSQIEQRRIELVERCRGSNEARPWIAALVRPTAEHLATLQLASPGSPTWYARFSAQLLTNPELRPILLGEVFDAPSLHQLLTGLDDCTPDLPDVVRVQRKQMCRQLMVNGYAEQEYRLAAGPTSPGSWEQFANGLIDAITGLWLAPWTAPQP